MRVIQHDAYDRRTFEEGLEAVPRLDAQMREATTETIPALLEDIFDGTYKAAPQWIDTPQPTLQEALLRDLMATKEFKNLKSNCVGDAVSTAIATDMLGRDLVPQLGDDMLDRIKNEAKTLEELQEAQERVKNLKNIQDDPDVDQEALATLVAEAEEEAEAAAVAAGAIPVPDPDEELGTIRRSFRKQAEEASKAVQDYNDTLEALGGNNTTSLKDKLALNNHVKRSSKLRKLVEISGRMRRVAVNKRASVIKEVPEEVVGIKMGDDLTRTLPSEMVLLLEPETEDLFWQKFADRELLNYDLSSEEKQGEGPIILLVDNSGSMMETFPGSGGITREIWSKAIVLGYSAIAEKEKRDLYVCHFADVGMLRHWQFPYASAPTEVKRENLVACLEFFSGGENDIDGALRWAVKQLDPPTGRWGRADITLLTDAEHTFHPQFLEEWPKLKEQFGFHTYGVLIQGSQATRRNLERVMDTVVEVVNLATDEDTVIDKLFLN